MNSKVQFNDQGEELPDPTPLEIPVGYGVPESLQESIRRMIRDEISAEAQAQGNESFEEANDFDMDDDDGPVSPYELSDMQLDATFDMLLKDEDGGNDVRRSDPVEVNHNRRKEDKKAPPDPEEKPSE